MNKFKTTIELDVEVVGHFTGATRATRDEPGESEDFEIEAVLLKVRKDTRGTILFDVLPALSEADLEALRQEGIERAEDALVDAMETAAEARRDAKEDR